MFSVGTDDGSMYNYNLSKTIITKSCVVGQTSKMECSKTRKQKRYYDDGTIFSH